MHPWTHPPAAQDIETVHAVFRAVHSIKGGAAAFGLTQLVEFAHLFETVLDGLRNARMTATDAIMDTLLRAGDVLSDLVAGARDGLPVAADRMARVAAELDVLAEGQGDDGEPFSFEPVALNFEPLALDLAPAGDAETTGPAVWVIGFAPRGELYATGNDPAPLFRALAQIGTLEVEPDLARIIPLDRLDPADPQLAWTLRLQTDASEEEIRHIFEFVEDLAVITVTREADLHERGHFGEEPVAPASVTAGFAPAPTATAPDPAPLPAPRPAPEAPPAHPVGPAATVIAMPQPATIRVNLDRVDRLINLIGELVIMEAMLSQVLASAGLDANSDAGSGLDRIRQLAGEIQESVMAIRAQPLRPVFQRMERILREVCDATGKRARLVTVGEATEVDKTVIERLVDPLTHMIRNSVDHGLEDAEARRAVGKPSEGTITLSAAHRSGRVIIEVSDDGKGIDRPRVRQIAEQKGLIPPGATLTPAEIDALLFLPGFSSKTDVSAISGRGVGLDVVKREIQALGGRVSIASAEGQGTTFGIALPLTLAVLEGMLLQFGDEVMVLPLSAIIETLSPASTTMHRLGTTGRVVANRGELIPVIDLARAFGVPTAGRTDTGGVLVVVETDGGIRAALAVDNILDQRQVVIKSLEDNYGAVPGIAAATILGDGRISLIIDPEEVVRGALADTPLSHPDRERMTHV